MADVETAFSLSDFTLVGGAPPNVDEGLRVDVDVLGREHPSRRNGLWLLAGAFEEVLE